MQTWGGVYPAIVIDTSDPEGQGRVKITLPWAPDTQAWARVATLMAGNNRGTWFIPDLGTEVLVAFEAGDADRPYVIGSLWNGRDRPPASMDGENNLKVLRSRNGVRIAIDDTNGTESLKLETPGGQRITLEDRAGSVVINDSNGNSIKLGPRGIEVMSSARVRVDASVVEINAGVLTINAASADFHGVVKADTVIAGAVVGGSYSPGAGNIW